MRLLFLILCALIIIFCNGEKTLPKELQDSAIFCDGCYGTISEIRTMMERSKGRKDLKVRIKEALKSVCSTDILRRYLFSPPKMVKVQKFIVDENIV